MLYFWEIPTLQHNFPVLLCCPFFHLINSDWVIMHSSFQYKFAILRQVELTFQLMLFGVDIFVHFSHRPPGCVVPANRLTDWHVWHSFVLATGSNSLGWGWVGGCTTCRCRKMAWQPCSIMTVSCMQLAWRRWRPREPMWQEIVVLRSRGPGSEKGAVCCCHHSDASSLSLPPSSPAPSCSLPVFIP